MRQACTGRRFRNRGGELLRRRRTLLCERLDARVLLAGDGGAALGADPLFDVNGDENLTPVDALIVVNAIAKETAVMEQPGADVDGNGWIDAEDALLVLEALASESRTSTPGAAADQVAHAPLTAIVLSGPSGSTAVSGPSGSTVVSGPSGSTSVSGPSGSTSVSGPSGSTVVSGPSGSTAISGPSGSTAVSGPSGSTAVSGPTGPAPPPTDSGPSSPSGPADPPPPSGPTGGLTYGDRVCADTVPEPWKEEARPTVAGKGTAVWTLGDTPVNSAADIPWIDAGPLYVRSPEYPDDGVGDDSQVGNLTIRKYRQYYLGEAARGQSVDNPSPTRDKNIDVVETRTAELGSVGTISQSATINVAITSEAQGLAATLGVERSSSITFEEREKSTSRMERTDEYTIPTCTILSVYDIWLVTEVQYYWEYWEDTVLGDLPPGFTTHSGFATATSKVWMGSGEVYVSNSVMRPVYWGDDLLDYEVVEVHPPVATPRLYD